MEFSNVGANCHYELCKQQTFVPLECYLCKNKFCKVHKSPKDHQCKNLEKDLTSKQTSLSKVKRPHKFG